MSNQSTYQKISTEHEDLEMLEVPDLRDISQPDLTESSGRLDPRDFEQTTGLLFAEPRPLSPDLDGLTPSTLVSPLQEDRGIPIAGPAPELDNNNVLQVSSGSSDSLDPAWFLGMFELWHG
jgi:hypothetical protein